MNINFIYSLICIFFPAYILPRYKEQYQLTRANYKEVITDTNETLIPLNKEQYHLTRANYKEVITDTNKTSLIRLNKPPVILLWTTFFGNQDFNFGLGVQPFKQHCNCTCELTIDKNRFTESSAIVVHPRDSIRPFPKLRYPWQRIVLFLLESPIHTPSLKAYGSVFNWTMTYRRDSDILLPYGQLQPKKVFNQAITVKNYAEGKTKLVFVAYSNCRPPSKRQNYIKHLSKHIEVDVYGACGAKSCPRNRDCTDTFKVYKFYLAFENSICKDYITEKAWGNALQNEFIPIVLGGSKYSEIFPPHSFMDIGDYNSPKDLSDYLKLVAANDTLYNSYFKWKQAYDVELSYRPAFCSLCHKLRNDIKTKVYPDLDGWWRNGACEKPEEKYSKLVEYFS